MSTLYFSLIERRDFGDLLTGEGVTRTSVSEADSLSYLADFRLSSDQMIVAVWPENPAAAGDLPSLLVCRDGLKDDWAAWITTYVAKLRPFTAFMRLVTSTELEMIAVGSRAPSLRDLTWPASGMILGEALSASGLPDKALETLPANVFESTLSFAIFRTWALFPKGLGRTNVVDGWERTRKLTRQNPRGIDTLAIASTCESVIEAASGSKQQSGLTDSDVVRAVRSILEFGGLSYGGSPHERLLSDVQQRMRGPREDRVVAFTQVVREMEGAAIPFSDEFRSFVLGYLASRIAPGTIQHSAVIAPLLSHYKAALLWYGFCAAFGDSEKKTSSGARFSRSPLDLPGSARWVVRSLLRREDYASRPSCDIALVELLALSRTGDDPLSGLTRTAQGTAVVEIIPGVSTVVNTHQRSNAAESGMTPRQREMLSSMGRQIERLRDMYGELIDVDTRGSQQAQLFPTKRKRP
jgi:hypothetical protein